MLEALRPYFGILVENGLSLLLGIANGVLMFLLALFVAFFFYVYGEPIADRLTPAAAPHRRRAGRPADHTSPARPSAASSTASWAPPSFRAS